MVITDLYDLTNIQHKRDNVQHAVMEKVTAIAECKFKHDPYEKFEIKVKLVPLNE